MAEIGIAASIIGIAGAAATIAKGLYQIASDIGSAGKQVRLIAQDTNAFSHALTNLGQLLSSGSVNTQRARAIAGDLVVLCKEILADSQTLLKVLEPLVKLTGRKWKRATLRVRWLFEKSKFAVHQQSLEALKATLTLLVATMTYVDAASANVSEAISSTLRAQLDSIREEVRLSTQEYEPLLFQIRDNVQAIRVEALLEYSKIDQPAILDAADTTDENVQEEPEAQTEAVESSGTTEPAYESPDDLAVPITALSIHTGLPGLPYLQRQAVHFADDVLDMDHSALVAESPQWKAAQAYQWGIKLITDSPAVNEPSSQGESVATRTVGDIERRRRQNLALSEAWGKIAYQSFKVGDLVLFLPTRNQATRPWAAFNVGAPHYFLREQEKHRLSMRDWLLARITRIEERVVDLNRSVSSLDEGNSGDDHNPFELSDGLRWWMLDAEEDKMGAPSTPAVGKSTVAATNVEATAQKTRKLHMGTRSSVDRSMLRKLFKDTAGLDRV